MVNDKRYNPKKTKNKRPKNLDDRIAQVSFGHDKPVRFKYTTLNEGDRVTVRPGEIVYIGHSVEFVDSVDHDHSNTLTTYCFDPGYEGDEEIPILTRKRDIIDGMLSRPDEVISEPLPMHQNRRNYDNIKRVLNQRHIHHNQYDLN